MAKLDQSFRSGTSKYRGVSTCKSWEGRAKPWRMKICIGETRIRTCHATEDEAARDYDRHAIRRDGRCVAPPPRPACRGLLLWGSAAAVQPTRILSCLHPCARPFRTRCLRPLSATHPLNRGCALPLPPLPQRRQAQFCLGRLRCRVQRGRPGCD